MRIHIFVAIAMLGCLGISSPSTAQGVLPRYKFEPGQEIRYQDRSEPRYDEGGGYHFQTTSTLWILGRNGDGSWEVFEQHVFTYQRLNPNGRAPDPPSTYLGRFNLFPDGRIEATEGSMANLGPRGVLPMLPDKATDRTWQAKQFIGGTYNYAALPGDGTNHFAFRCEDHWNNNWLYLIEHSDTLDFDLQRGMLISARHEWSQGYPRKSKGSGTLTLESVQMKDAAFIKQLASESETYFKATADYDRAEAEAGKDAAKMASIMQQARQALETARARITLPLLADPIDKLLSRHDLVAKSIQQDKEDEARHIAAAINKTAASWELKDLSGATHRLSDYRGKVVVLDFWYRGCGYCIESMPQMKQVADDFKADPVAVLGMNTDADEKDAAFIAEKMALNYPTLLAPNVPAAYGVQGFPTVILIDAGGIVRDIHVGYSPNLREKLDQAVRKVLTVRDGNGHS